MTAWLQFVLIAAVIVFLMFIVRSVKRRRVLLRDALLWLLLGVVGLVAAVWPQWVFSISGLLGFETPAGFLFFFCIAYLMGMAFLLSVSLSRQSARIKTLIQEVSLLKLQIEDMKKELAIIDGPSGDIEDADGCRGMGQKDR